MKQFKPLIIFLYLLSLSTVVNAADVSSLTRSAGKLVADISQNLDTQLSTQPVDQSSQSKQRNSQDSSLSTSKQSYKTANHAIAVEFEIYDAWIELSGDIDNDGYYQRIKTTFDADVNTPLETVYASLYLSYEGGPWHQVANSELYEISYDSIDDSYEIVTELIDGYPPGYYDVLIELHSLYYEGVVASRILTQDLAGYPITLEDQQQDDFYLDPVYQESELYLDTGHVHVGSFSSIGLLLLVCLWVIKLSYFSAPSFSQKNKN